jgi:pimeloyl-ACP methyl ester carboxylesterase
MFKRLVLSLILGAACTALAAAAPVPQAALADHGYFFAGGSYQKDADGMVMNGAMYVHFMVPQRKTHPYPIVMIHGANQSGTNFEGTPDGREGWADYFVEHGFAVYVVDQPARGRSAYHPELDGKIHAYDAVFASERWIATERLNRWPQAKYHTQWPGTGPQRGQMGDSVFDQLAAAQVEGLVDTDETEQLMRAAGAALLDRIGPAILLTHSQGGQLGWQIADARPKLIKGILALEPSAGPYYVPPLPASITPATLGPAYGITSSPIAYSPAITSPAQLTRVPQTAPDTPDLQPCWQQAEPARTLVNLQGFPVLVLVSQASAFAQTEHCMSRYLAQAGVRNNFVRLEDVGIMGNGHMMMLEKNNLAIADYLIGYLRGKGL